MQDIGESNPENIGLPFPPGGFVNAPTRAYPDNDNNDFNPLGIEGDDSSILNPAIRDIATVQSGFSGLQTRRFGFLFTHIFLNCIGYNGYFFRIYSS